MSQDDLAERLDAVERRLDAAYPEPTEGAVDSDTIERVEGFAERLADLEAAVEAVEGYVGEVERVDEELERRADAALARADDLEARVESIESELEAVRSQRSTDLDDRLAEQTAALEQLRSAVDAIDDRVAVLEPEDGRGADAVSDGSDRDPSARCTCDEQVGTEFEGATTPADARRSAADGGFEPTDRSVATEQETGGWTPPDGPAIGADPTAPDDSPGAGRSPPDPTDRPNPTDRPSRIDREPPSSRSTGRGRSTSARSAPGDTSVTGWGDDPGDPPRRADPGAGDAPGDPVARSNDPDDPDWTDASSETLLDRLRSLL